MLIRRETLQAIARGEVTLAFRRWTRPTVKAGGRLTTSVGVLAIEAVERIEEARIDDEDARRAGYADRHALLDAVAKRSGELFRIRLSLAGPDPRVALRERAELDAAEWAEVQQKLDRLDGASRNGPWTAATLALIAAREGVLAERLASSLELPKAVFKRRVRRLKALGLTESLEVGYRLSPRGRAVLERLS
jgi:hypothetical protein